MVWGLELTDKVQDCLRLRIWGLRLTAWVSDCAR